MVELYEKLSDAKMALVDAREELRSKDEEIAELKKRFEFREQTVMFQGRRYERDENGRPLGAPFCSRCEEVDGTMIRLTRVMNNRHVVCPACKAPYDARTPFFAYPE